MTMRQDALKALRGERPECLPFIARMDLWYNYNKSCGTLPAPYQSAGLWDIQRDLGIGVLGFGAWIRGFYQLEYDDTVTFRSWWEGRERVDEYVTPYGTLRGRSLISEQLQAADVTPTHVEYLFKTAADYDALQYLFDHTRVVENYDEYTRYLAGIGDAGLSLPFTSWAPMHLLMKEYIGYNQFYYELYDNLSRLESLVESATRVHLDMVRIGIDSPAQVIEVGANYDQVMTPPPIFRAYMLPFYQQMVPMLHAAGKVVALHGDGDMGPELLGLMAETGVDAVEALTPRPMTSIDVSTTRALWGNRMTLWGGIPGILMTDTYSDEDVDTFLEELFSAVAPGERFVLGFGDNVPTNGLYSRILQVVDFYHRHSSYPLG